MNREQQPTASSFGEKDQLTATALGSAGGGAASLGAEGMSTAAGSDGVRIFDLKSAAHQVVDIVDGGTIQ